MKSNTILEKVYEKENQIKTNIETKNRRNLFTRGTEKV